MALALPISAQLDAPAAITAAVVLTQVCAEECAQQVDKRVNALTRNAHPRKLLHISHA